jgi:hypothetical protein
MYGYTVHVKHFLMEATVTVFVAVGISFDDEPTRAGSDSWFLESVTVGLRPSKAHENHIFDPAMSRRDRSVLPAQSSRSMGSTDTSVIPSA